MNTTTTPAPCAPNIDRSWSYWRQLRRTEQVCYLIGAALLASGLVHVGVFAVERGPLYGPVSWRKPITFRLSFGTTLITTTWVATYLSLGPKARASLLDCILEVAGITIQAWRHVPSHFNTKHH